MTDMSFTPDSNNVINLSARKTGQGKNQQDRYRMKVAWQSYGLAGKKTCSHKNVLIDSAKTEVECEDCGARINPVWLLGEFMRIESQWSRQLAELKRQIDQAADKTRCKCAHCGKMTQIGKR